MNIVKNNHYISESCLKAWKMPSKPGHVLTYRPDVGRVEPRSIKKIFSMKEVYSNAEEKFMKTAFEDALGVFRKRFNDGCMTSATSNRIIHPRTLKEVMMFAGIATAKKIGDERFCTMTLVMEGASTCDF